MFPIQVEGPAVEPVSLADMKAYLRVDDDAEDELVAGLIKAARLMVEATARRVLITQSWRLMLPEWPASRSLALPLSPVIAIDKVEMFDAAGLATQLAADAYALDPTLDPPRLMLRQALPSAASSSGLAVAFRAGFGPVPEDVPATLRLALKIIVARWFENRGDVAGEQTLPREALALIAPFQRPRL